MFKHLLVPLDGSELAETALPMALAIAERFDSKVTLLQAVHLPRFTNEDRTLVDLYLNLSQEMQQEAEAYLQAKQKVLRATGYSANYHIVVEKAPADAILLAADELGVDAIVMSTHGHGGLARWVFGSVADKVLRRAHVPILLTRIPPLEEASALQMPAIESEEDIRAHHDPLQTKPLS